MNQRLRNYIDHLWENKNIRCASDLIVEDITELVGLIICDDPDLYASVINDELIWDKRLCAFLGDLLSKINKPENIGSAFSLCNLIAERIVKCGFNWDHIINRFFKLKEMDMISDEEREEIVKQLQIDIILDQQGK